MQQKDEYFSSHFSKSSTMLPLAQSRTRTGFALAHQKRAKSKLLFALQRATSIAILQPANRYSCPHGGSQNALLGTLTCANSSLNYATNYKV